MRPGGLRQRVTIQNFTTSQNPFWWRHSGMVRRCDSLGRSEGEQWP